MPGHHLWRSLNEFQELTQNMRQSDDPEYGHINSAARLGTITNQQVATLNTRLHLTVEQVIEAAPAQAMWVASKNKIVDEVNTMFYQLLTANRGLPGFRFWAHHAPKNLSIEPPNRETCLKVLQIQGGRKSKLTDTEDGTCVRVHPNYVDLAIGMRVALTYNAATLIGLYAGSPGTIHSFAFPHAQQATEMPTANEAASINALLPVVFVVFDKYTGIPFNRPPEGETWELDDPRFRMVPITATPSKGALKHKYTRFQLPLRAAHATTIHKVQGMSCPIVLIPSPSPKDVFAMGLDYVGISRARFLHELFIYCMDQFNTRSPGPPLTAGHFQTHADQRKRIAQEYARLRALFPY